MRELWADLDDYPDDDYRNREYPTIGVQDGDREAPEFNFLAGKGESLIGREVTHELTIEADDPVDVWIGPKQESMEDLSDPELLFEDDGDFEYYDRYSEQSTDHYAEAITVPDDEEYWYYVFAAGEVPSMALWDREFVDITVELESYYYVPFEEWYADRQ